MERQSAQFTIGQAAAATGLSVDTLRYYERSGLIHPIGRMRNAHRRYSADDIGWIQFLTKLRATGMSIKQMLAYAELQRQGDATMPARLAILQAHQLDVERRLAVLQEHLELIKHKIQFYEGLIRQTPTPGGMSPCGGPARGGAGRIGP